MKPGRGPYGEPVPTPHDNDVVGDISHYDETQRQLQQSEEGQGQMVPAEEKSGIVGRVKRAFVKRREAEQKQQAEDLRVWREFKQARVKYGEKRAFDLIAQEYGSDALRRLTPYLARESRARGGIDLARQKARASAMQSQPQGSGLRTVRQVFGPKRSVGLRSAAASGRPRLTAPTMARVGVAYSMKLPMGAKSTSERVVVMKDGGKPPADILGLGAWRPRVAYRPSVALAAGRKRRKP